MGLNGSDAAGSLEYASTIIGGRSYTFGRNENPNKRYNTLHR